VTTVQDELTTGIAMLLLLLGVTACGKGKLPPLSTARTVTVSGWVRNPDGASLPPGHVVLDPWWLKWGNQGDTKAGGVEQRMLVDESGRFTFAFDDMPRDQNLCLLDLHYELDGFPWRFAEDEPWIRWTVKHPIPDQLSFGAVHLTAPSSARPFADLADDQLEARLRESWSAGSKELPLPWDALLLETARREGPRWQALFEELLASFLEADRDLEPREESEHWQDHGELELVTALRRRQGRPDPVSVEVLRGSDLVVESLAMPRVVVRVRNQDVVPVNVPLRNCDWYWRIRGRASDGAPLLHDRNVVLGFCGASGVTRLDPGKETVTELKLADCLQSFTGKAEVQITFCNQCCILDPLVPLEGLFLFHAASVDVEVRPPGSRYSPIRRVTGPDLWPVVADDVRMRDLAREAGITLLESEGVQLVSGEDFEQFLDVLEKHDALLERVDGWVQQTGGYLRRVTDPDKVFAEPNAGPDDGDGARSLLTAHSWLEYGGASGARFVFHVRVHTGR
jgi:hypothetical protein